MTTGTLALEAIGLERSFGRSRVLTGFDLSVADGGIVVLRGSNGAGKSTVLRGLAGAAPIDAGVVRLHGRPSTPSSPEHWSLVHSVLDDFAWLPDLTIADQLRLLSPTGDTVSVSAALQALDVAHLADRLPESLSAGQRQRAALTTAAVRPWSLLLLDEPERHLDDTGITELAAFLTAHVHAGRGIVIATHADRLVDLLGCPVVTLDDSSRD